MKNSNLATWAPDPQTSYPFSELPPELQAMLNEFDEIIADQSVAIETRRYANQPPETLHHYTNAIGLKGIAFDENIWLSDFRMTNDPTDGVYAKSFLVGAVKEILPLKLQEAITWPLHSLDPTIENRLAFITSSLHQRFIACFTPNPDQLYQWVHYGAGGKGYCIGIDTKSLISQTIELAAGVAVKPSLYPVEYDENVLNEFITRLLELVLETYIKHEKALHIHPVAMSHLYSKVGYVLDWASRAIGLDFKSKHFEDEQEWRCVISPLTPLFSAPVRVKGESLCPYFPLKVTVRSIKSGPKTNHEDLKIAWGTRMFTRKPQVELTPSQIPLK